MSDPYGLQHLLRVYEAHECDEHGNPLDYDRCRCADDAGAEDHCPHCAGHGSLRAAVIAALSADSMHGPRCEACAHPLSPGVWANLRDTTSAVSELRSDLAWAFSYLVVGQWPPEFHLDDQLVLGDDEDGRERELPMPQHFSDCDEHCRHRGVYRFTSRGGGWTLAGPDAQPAGEMVDAYRSPFQALWREVDVRCGQPLGGPRRWAFSPEQPLHTRPFDLRPHNLQLLCLCCWAEQIAASRMP